LPRLAQWALVIFIGATVTFLIPRLSPINPVDAALGRVKAVQNINPEAAKALRQTIQDLYGLNGSILDQYVSFWNRLLHGDLGPSFGQFPTSVNEIIASSIWWTVGLLGTTTVLAWLIGLVLGSLAGYYPRRWWSEALDKSLAIVYPVPYYIIAFVLLLAFT